MRETVLRALWELDRWTRREDELRRDLAQSLRAGESPDGRTAFELRSELEKVQRQVSHYQALTHDMKRSSRPSRFGDLLRIM